MSETYEVPLGGEKLRISINTNLHQHKNTWTCNRHSNADYELHIILKGSCTLEIEDHRYTLEAPQAIIISPGIYHMPRSLQETFERITISFTPAGSILKKQLVAEVPISKVFRISQEICDVSSNIFREYETKEAFQHELVGALLTKLMICCFRILNISVKPVSSVSTEQSALTDQIDDFFENYIEHGITAPVLAQKLNLSRRQLDRVLKQSYGMGFREKLICSRMDRASWLLRSTDKPIHEIIFESGYVSEAAFYAVFKAIFDKTPAEYRAHHVQDAD